MKRITAVLLILALLYTIVPFNSSAEEISVDAKYSDLIDLLDSGEYDAASDWIKINRPFEEVTISLDNFFDYYEMNKECLVFRDDNGRIVHIQMPMYLFGLKNEYLDSLDKENSSVKVGIKGQLDIFRVKIDWETGEYTVGDKAGKSVINEIKKWGLVFKIDTQFIGQEYIKHINEIDIPSSCDPFCMFTSNSSGIISYGGAERGKNYKYYQAVPTEFEIVSAEGTLRFLK